MYNSLSYLKIITFYKDYLIGIKDTKLTKKHKTSLV